MASQMAVQTAPLLSLMAQEVAKLQREWTEAALHGDTGTLNQLLSEDFIVMTPVGELNKAQCMEEIERGDLKFESITCEDAVVRDYGDAAVVSGIVTVKGQYQGRDISGQYGYRSSEAYLKNPMRWQILTGQVRHITS
jgi:ketosteroid isomerase-like protein